MKIQGIPAEYPTYELTIIGEDGKAAAETAEGHVGLGHKETYKLRFNNASNERVVAKTSIDGKPVGDFVIDARGTVTIERPLEAEQLFTFLKSGTKQSKAAGLKDVAVDNRGLVTVTFVPEKKIDYTKIRLPKHDFELLGGGLRRGGGNHMMGGDLLSKSAMRGGSDHLSEGITGLSGHSRQSFRTISVDLDDARAVVLNLRLAFEASRKAEPEIRPLGGSAKPAAPSTPVPPPLGGKRSPV